MENSVRMQPHLHPAIVRTLLAFGRPSSPFKPGASRSQLYPHSQLRAFTLAPSTGTAKPRGALARAGTTPPPPSSFSRATNISATAAITSPSTLRTAQIARHISTASPSQQHPDKMSSSPYTLRKVAAPHTLEHRVYIEKDGVPISAFHDIPLYVNAEQTILNMIVEIPRWTNAKQEVCLPLALRAN